MNVEQLIEALKRYPAHRPVRVTPAAVHREDKDGPLTYSMDERDASEADEVHDRGAFVLIQGK